MSTCSGRRMFNTPFPGVKELLGAGKLPPERRVAEGRGVAKSKKSAWLGTNFECTTTRRCAHPSCSRRVCPAIHSSQNYLPYRFVTCIFLDSPQEEPRHPCVTNSHHPSSRIRRCQSNGEVSGRELGSDSYGLLLQSGLFSGN